MARKHRIYQMKPCKFTFADDKEFDGFAYGTTWNGFDNVAVTKETAAKIHAHFGEDDQVHEIEPDENGLISLAYGFATEIVR